VDKLSHYRRVWFVDYEFTARPGYRPDPRCLVARELRTGQLIRHWFAGDPPPVPPYDTGTDSLFIAYYASAELGCHLALGWPMPARIVDLYVEFCCCTSGLPVPCGRKLLGALAYFGLPAIDGAEKEAMRDLAMRGGSYSPAERAALLNYCQTDVDALARLLPAMLPGIDLPRALLRGRSMVAAAREEWVGIPIDTDALARLRRYWTIIKGRLIAAINEEYGVYVPADRRPPDRQSQLGAAILGEAEERNINPQHLADAVTLIWKEEREAVAEQVKAVRAARKLTGLTASRIARWEATGKDYSQFPGLDDAARQLARQFPVLGIDPEHVFVNDPDGDADGPDGDADGADGDGVSCAKRLWDRLRDGDPGKPRHHPDILHRAAELVVSLPPGWAAYLVPMRFSSARFADYLLAKGIPWQRLESGALNLEDDIFREMARAYPKEIGPIRELRYALSQLRLNKLTVGPDGRNRCLLSAFRSKTGRNQPSNARYIFGPATWLRCLIRPSPGRAIAYVDWSAQELGIAAALSGDRVMQEAYRTGDPYLFLARRAGAVPLGATKQTHATEREQFKIVSLGVLYGLSAQGLARKLDLPDWHGRLLLQMHQETFPQFWAWSEAVEVQAMLTGSLRTVFGWEVHVPDGLDKNGKPLANPRSLRNFPMQANGAEMLRLACCLATERGITVCAPVHDALLVEGSIDEIDAVVEATQSAMREASELVLPGFPLRTDAKVVRYPDRYRDERGGKMWDMVWDLMAELESETPKSAGATLPVAPAPDPSHLIISSI
jgi:hypothetical protein